MNELTEYAYIKENLATVRERLAAAAARGGYPVPKLMTKKELESFYYEVGGIK